MTTDPIAALEPYEENRPWGHFRRFAQNVKSTVKIIVVNPGETLSLQSHDKRAEFWHVISGTGTVDIDGATSHASKGAEFSVSVGSKHRLSADEGSILEILEIATGDFEEGDIVRYEDKYGRISESSMPAK